MGGSQVLGGGGVGGFNPLGFSTPTVVAQPAHPVAPRFRALSFQFVAVVGGVTANSRREVGESLPTGGLIASPERRMGGMAEVRGEPLLRMFGVGPSGVDTRAQGPDGRGRRVPNSGLLLPDGLQLPKKLEVKDSAPVHSPMLRGDRGGRWFRTESGAASMLSWRLTFSLLDRSSVLLGANVEGVSSGVGDGEHGGRVIDSVSGAELGTKLGLDLVP